MFGCSWTEVIICTLNSSESIWPTPFSIGVYWNEEPSPEGQRDIEISLCPFISSLFYGVGQLLPRDFAGLLMCRPRLLTAGDSCCQKVLQRFSWSIQGVLGSQVFGQALMESTVIWMGLVLAASSQKTDDHVSIKEEGFVLIIWHNFNIPIVTVQIFFFSFIKKNTYMFTYFFFLVKFGD